MMLPRTIDKARALLPGGDPGDYAITPGLSAWLLSEIGISESELLVLVHRAADEHDVARAVEQRVPPERREPLNERMKTMRVRDLAPDARERFLRLHEAQDDALVIDVLVADDRGLLQPARQRAG
jgi:Domain of unknown function (DUF5069)